MATIDLSCCKCRLITEECFFDITGLPKNILMENMIRAWNIAHDLELKNLIGVDCANELCSAGYYTPAQEAMIAQLQNWLAFTILYYYTVESWTGQYKNYGITDTNTDTESSINEGKYQEKKAQLLATIAGYKAIFMDWLLENLEDYPCSTLKKKCPPDSMGLNVDILPI